MPDQRHLVRRSLKSTPVDLPSHKDAYEKDFYKWTRTQANLLKKEEFDKLDIQHLMVEIESLGNSEKRALESYLIILLMHLLKIEFQPTNHSKSWDLSVKNSRFRIARILQQNPSLKTKLPVLFKDAYYSARLEAAQETGLDENLFPEECPWTIKKAISEI